MTPLDTLLRELWPVMCRAAAGEDWPPRTEAGAQRLVELAYRHRLLPLLSTVDLEPGPLSTVIQRSSAFARAHELRTKTLLATIQRFSDVAGDEDYILYKGCDFAFHLYPAPQLRPMSDIDVFVPAPAIQRWRERLKAAGLVPHYALPSSRVPGYHEFVFRGLGSTVELHVAFLQKPRHRIDYDAIWLRRRPFGTAVIGASRMAACDAALALCLAIAGDHFEFALIRLVDLHLLLAKEPGVLEETVALARQWKCERAVWATLRYYMRVFPQSAPAGVETAAASLLTRRARTFIERHVLPPALVATGSRPRRRIELWRKFWLMDDYRHRIAFFASHVAESVSGSIYAMRGRDSSKGHDLNSERG